MKMAEERVAGLEQVFLFKCSTGEFQAAVVDAIIAAEAAAYERGKADANEELARWVEFTIGKASAQRIRARIASSSQERTNG